MKRNRVYHSYTVKNENWRYASIHNEWDGLIITLKGFDISYCHIYSPCSPCWIVNTEQKMLRFQIPNSKPLCYMQCVCILRFMIIYLIYSNMKGEFRAMDFVVPIWHSSSSVQSDLHIELTIRHKNLDMDSELFLFSVHSPSTWTKNGLCSTGDKEMMELGRGKIRALIFFD